MKRCKALRGPQADARWRSRIPSWVWIVGAFVLICLALIVLIERSVEQRADDAVAADRNAVAVDVLARQVAAERIATTNQMQRDEAFRDDQEELKDVVREKGTDDRPGGATAAVLERMREQQAAGRR